MTSSSVAPTWDGKYGGFFGFGETGAMEGARYTVQASDAKHKNGAKVAYASLLYSIAGDFYWWQAWYWPLRLVAFLRLRRLMIDLVSGAKKAETSFLHYGGFEWSAEQSETLTGIILTLADSPSFTRYRQEWFVKGARAFVKRGLAVSSEATASHVQALLHLHAARICFRDAHDESKHKIERSTARSTAMDLLAQAAKLEKVITHTDQRARCCRHLAEIYRYDVCSETSARAYMMLAMSLPVGTASRRKLEKARRRMGL